MYKLTNFSKWMNKLEKKLQNYVKKLIFGQAYIKFVVAMATSKMTDTIDISKFPQKMNEQLLKFSAP